MSSLKSHAVALVLRHTRKKAFASADEMNRWIARARVVEDASSAKRAATMGNGLIRMGIERGGVVRVALIMGETMLHPGVRCRARGGPTGPGGSGPGSGW